MARFLALRVILVAAAGAVVAVAAVTARDADDDRIARERRVWQVIAEHTEAINKCDIPRLMAQHPYVSRESGGEGDRMEQVGSTAG